MHVFGRQLAFLYRAKVVVLRLLQFWKALEHKFVGAILVHLSPLLVQVQSLARHAIVHKFGRLACSVPFDVIGDLAVSLRF